MGYDIGVGLSGSSSSGASSGIGAFSVTGGGNAGGKGGALSVPANLAWLPWVVLGIAALGAIAFFLRRH